MKRLNDGEFKMCLTDKSNHHAVIGNEEYLEMGREHTKKDKKITLDEAIKVARESDRHTSMMLKIFNLGQDPKQKQRFRESYLNNKNREYLLHYLTFYHPKFSLYQITG